MFRQICLLPAALSSAEFEYRRIELKRLLVALSLVFSGSAFAEAETPEQFLTNMISVFNTGDAEGHISHFATPHVRIINGVAVLQTDDTPFVDFDMLRKGGWASSRIDSMELIAETDDAAMVLAGFSRMNSSNEAMTSMRVVYTLSKQGETWEVVGLSAVAPTSLVAD